MERFKLSEKMVNEAIKRTAEVLAGGGLVVYPSDTVYGLLVDATNEAAVEKLIAFKNRPIGKAISVFVSGEMLEDTVEVGTHEKMVSSLLPGPFTIVLPSKGVVSRKLESEKRTLGIRIPDYEPVTKLINTYGKPVTATSANLAGRPSHYSVDSLLNELPENKKGLIDLVVDAGKLPRNKPSTVVDLTHQEMKVLRKGDILFENEQTFKSTSPTETKKLAQFLLKKYGATKKSLAFIIKGDLGAGKTVFSQGIGEKYEIADMPSPTFVVYYEYDLPKDSSFSKLYHFDLYQLEEETEFEHLMMPEMFEKKNLFSFEWGEKSSAILPHLQEKAYIVYIEMKHVSEKERLISVTSAK